MVEWSSRLAVVGLVPLASSLRVEQVRQVVEIHGVHHIALKTSRVTEVTRFYRDVLGLRETRRQDDEHGLRSVWLSAGSVLLMIERSTHQRQSLERPSQERSSAGTRSAGTRREETPSKDTSSPESSDERSLRPIDPTQHDAFRLDAFGYHLVAFRIERDEHEVWRRHLEAHQHPIVHETPFTIYVSDPDGNRVGMSSWPEARTS